MAHTIEDMPVWAQGLYTLLVAVAVPVVFLGNLDWMTPLGVFAMFQATAVAMLPLLYWNRSKYTWQGRRRMAAMLLLFPLMLAGFAVPFYYVMEVYGQQGFFGQAVAAALGLAWVGGLLWAICRVFPGGELAIAAGGVRYDPETYRREYEQAKADLIAKLQADPRLARFVEEVENHQVWSYEEAVYLADPALTATCQHLRGVEAAMRAAGVKTRRTFVRIGQVHPSQIWAPVVLDEAAVREQFRLPGFVLYSSYFNEWEDRGPRSDARLTCEKCGSAIQVRHPEESGPDTPRFPA